MSRVLASTTIPADLVAGLEDGALEQYIIGRIRQKMDEYWKAEAARLDHLMVHGTGVGPRSVGFITAIEGAGLA